MAGFVEMTDPLSMRLWVAHVPIPLIRKSSGALLGKPAVAPDLRSYLRKQRRHRFCLHQLARLIQVVIDHRLRVDAERVID